MASVTESKERYLVFSGKEDHWHEWKVKLRSLATTKRWVQALDNDLSESEDETEILQNSNMYNYMLMCCSEDAFKRIEGAKGNARKAYLSLQEHYELGSAGDIETLINDFSRCLPYRKSEDPSLWFLRLERIRDKIFEIGEKIDSENSKNYFKNDFEMITHVNNNSPDKYYKNLKTILRQGETKPNWTKVKNAYKREWKDTVKKKNDTQDRGEAFSVTNFQKRNEGNGRPNNYSNANPNYLNNTRNFGNNSGSQSQYKKSNTRFKPTTRKFKGYCRSCGRIGHKSQDCRSKTGNSNNTSFKSNMKSQTKFDKSNMNCFGCGAKGHFKAECPKKASTGMFVGTVISVPPTETLVKDPQDDMEIEVQAPEEPVNEPGEIKSDSAVATVKQEDPESEMDSYTYHSGGNISTMESEDTQDRKMSPTSAHQYTSFSKQDMDETVHAPCICHTPMPIPANMYPKM